MVQIVCLIYHTTAYKGGRCEDNSRWCVEVTCQCSAQGEVSRLINPLPYRWYSRWCERFRNYRWMSASVIRAAIKPYNTIVVMCQEEVSVCYWIVELVILWGDCVCTSLSLYQYYAWHHFHFCIVLIALPMNSAEPRNVRNVLQMSPRTYECQLSYISYRYV